jgi:hypothetical protein
MLAFGLSYLFSLLFIQGSTPAVFILGASSPESAQIQHVLSVELNLYIGAVSSLLNMQSSENEAVGIVNFGGAQRITDDDWRGVGRTLSKLVKLIVIDMRKLTPFVEEELEWIYEEKLLDKCIFFAPQGWDKNALELRLDELNLVTDIKSIVVESEKVLSPTQ